MDWKKTLGRINSGVKITSNIIESGTILDPNIILSAAFDRRISTYQEFLSSYEPYLRLDWRDFPTLSHPKRIAFKSENNLLRGYLYLPHNPLGIVLAVHGINSLSNNHNAIFHDHFFRRGFAVLAIDLTACGESEGLGIKGLHQSALDVASALKWIHGQEKLNSLPLYLFGHSWGGYGVCASLAFDTSPKAIASFSGFLDPWAMILGLPENYVGEIAHIGESKVHEAYAIRAGEFAFLSAYEAINNSQKTQVLLVHGSQDEVIKPRSALAYASYTNPRIRTIIRNNADHNNLFYSKECRLYQNEVGKSLKELKKAYGRKVSDVPSSALEAFKSSFSREKCSVLDEELFEEIDDFFLKAARN